ncbi:ALK tyrosine kinase receptor-like [Tubulanus polymorphus]|uniref:ALK tyrosine kinase receptor-like n=1 Tax=Tubulanus polymorphus TaxID=672921 RepID=UPI003DA2BD68
MFGINVGTISVKILRWSGASTEIWFDNKDKGNVWAEHKMDIGALSEPFKIQFEIIRGTGDKGLFAIDSISLPNCSKDHPTNYTCGINEFQCNNSLCISKDRLCDFSKDCYYGEDEQQNCDKIDDYAHCNFENNSKLCGWEDQTDSKHGLQWARYKPSDGEKQDHPYVDHTLRSPNGHYLYMRLDSRRTKLLSFAAFVSPWIPPPRPETRTSNSTEFGMCKLRLFVHMFKARYGVMSGVIQLWDPAPERADRRKAAGQVFMKIDTIGVGDRRWFRQTASIPPSVNTWYRIVIEAAPMFSRQRGVMAIDDISLSPECFDRTSNQRTLRILERMSRDRREDRLQKDCTCTTQGGRDHSPRSFLMGEIVADKFSNKSIMYDFDTCGAKGRYGPTQTQCDSAYKLTAVKVKVHESGRFPGAQEWIVPETGNYSITALGARGGKGQKNGQEARGGYVHADFLLKKGERLLILVGQEGQDACPNHKNDLLRRICESGISDSEDEELFKNMSGGGGGGGGASWVFKIDAETGAPIPLIVAGGGGGMSYRKAVFPVLAVGGITPVGDGYNAKTWPYSPGGGGGFRNQSEKMYPQRGRSLMQGAAGGEPCPAAVAAGWHNYGGFGGGGGPCTAGGGGGGYTDRTDSNERHSLSDDFPVPALVGIIIGIIATIVIVGILILLVQCVREKRAMGPLRLELFNAFTSHDLQLERLRQGQLMTEYNPHYDFCGAKCSLEDLKQVPRDKLSLVSALGQGAFGEVYKGYLLNDKGGSLAVAVKTLPALSTEQAELDFLMEALIMSKFEYVNICSFMGVCFEMHPRFIVLELLEGGDLKTFLRDSRPKPGLVCPLSMVDLLNMSIDVAKGCQYLEENHFIHRDIAARNCLLTTKGPGRVVKIADFGMARDVYRADYYRKGGKAMLPVKWMPPEAFMDGIFTSKTDVWSFGILLWEVFSLGYMPYPGRGNQEVMQFVSAGGRLEPPQGCPVPIFHIMTLCWHAMYERRPTFGHILEMLDRSMQDPEVTEAKIPSFMRRASFERDLTIMRPDDSHVLESPKKYHADSDIEDSTEHLLGAESRHYHLKELKKRPNMNFSAESLDKLLTDDDLVSEPSHDVLKQLPGDYDHNAYETPIKCGNLPVYQNIPMKTLSAGQNTWGAYGEPNGGAIPKLHHMDSPPSLGHLNEMESEGKDNMACDVDDDFGDDQITRSDPVITTVCSETTALLDVVDAQMPDKAIEHDSVYNSNSSLGSSGRISSGRGSCDKSNSAIASGADTTDSFPEHDSIEFSSLNGSSNGNGSTNSNGGSKREHSLEESI